MRTIAASFLVVVACAATAKRTETTSISSCRVLKLRPPPQLHVQPCGETMDCLPWFEALELAKWIADVEETRLGLEGCPYVEPVTDK